MTGTEEKTGLIDPPASTHDKRGGKDGYFTGNVADRLNFAKRGIDGIVNNKEVRNFMANFSYNDEKINQFQETYTIAVAANSKQQKEFSDKTGAYENFEKLFSRTKEEYSTIRKIAKIALKNNLQKMDLLGLNQKRVKRIAEIFAVMQSFYDNLLADQEVISMLAIYSYDEKKINQLRDNFIQARDAHNNYYKENSEAVEATRDRDAKMADLDEWMSDFYGICKVALAQRPDLLAQLSAN